MTDPHRCYLALCGIVKDENPFLREWVAYYHLMGFERIFLYDNGSKIPVRETLRDMSEAGIVETYQMEGEMMQLVAYNHCLHHHGKNCQWMAFFDMDEFLLLKESLDARAFVAEFEAYGGVAVNMNFMSSNGHLKRPEGLVIENYLESCGATPILKCLVQPRFVKMPFTPHNFIHTDGQITVNTERIPVFGAYAPLALEQAELFHYAYRSQQDYEEKLRRGDAFRPFSIRQMDSFYHQAASPTSYRDDMLRYGDRVRRLMQEPKMDMYHPVDAVTIREEPYRTSLLRLHEAVHGTNKNSAGTAQLIFALNHERFRGHAAYLTLGIKACRDVEDYRRARRAALDLIRLVPEPASYLELIRIEGASGNKADASNYARFLLDYASYHEDTETRDLANGLVNEFNLF